MNEKERKNNLTYSFPDMEGELLLRELILYIANACINDPRFGKTKLNKILWFSDFISYRKFGKPITGVCYIRQPYGAVAQSLDDLISEMWSAGEIEVKRQPVVDYNQQRVIALKDPDLSRFADGDIALVDEVIRELWNMWGYQVSDFSHLRAYNVVRPFQPIPYQATLLSDEPITERDITRTKELNAKYEWEMVHP